MLAGPGHAGGEYLGQGLAGPADAGSACLPVLAGPALLAVVPVLRTRLTPTARQPAATGPAGDTVLPAAQAASGDR
jgi:hypothetical protein